MRLARAVVSSLRTTFVCTTRSSSSSSSCCSPPLFGTCTSSSCYTTTSAFIARRRSAAGHSFRQHTSSREGGTRWTTSTSTSGAAAARSYASSSRLSLTAAASGSDMLTQFSGTARGQNVALAMESLVSADAVCFDVDSTVITEEGIDELAAHLGKGPQVAALTAAAMEGGLKFQDALRQRLDLLQPSRQQIQECLRRHPFHFSPHLVELVRTLQQLDKSVYLISGGFRIMIEPVAERLGIPPTHIYANTLTFDERTGAYTGFDATEPTSRDMGKPRAVQSVIDRGNHRHGVVMIGDGATDAQAKPPAVAFIGFGGVAVRDKVLSTADWFVTDFADCLQVLERYYGANN